MAADHVAGCLRTGTISAGALADLIATAPDFATKIMMSMQTTAVETNQALLDMDISEIERARDEVRNWSNHGGNFAIHEDVGSSENANEEAEEESEVNYDETGSTDAAERESDVNEDDDDEKENEPPTEDEDSDEEENEQPTEEDEENGSGEDEDSDGKENEQPTEDDEEL